jgi:hypothetical protein
VRFTFFLGGKTRRCRHGGDGGGWVSEMVAAELPIGTVQTLIGGCVGGASGSSSLPRTECH